MSETNFLKQVLGAALLGGALLLPLGAAAEHDNSRAGNFLAGMSAIEKRDYDSASHFLGSIVGKGTSNSELLLRSVIADTAAGRVAAAEENAERALQEAGDHQVPLLVLALKALRDGYLTAADGYLQRLGPRGAEGVVGVIMRAWVQAAEGESDAAVSSLEEFAQEQGLEIIAAIHRAMILDVAGRLEEAAAYYGEARTRSDFPSLRLALTLSNFYRRNGQPDQAVQVLEEFLARNPELKQVGELLSDIEAGKAPEPIVASPGEGVAEILFDVASLLAQERGGDIALVYARLALSQNPALEEARILVGEILQDFERHADAVEAYRAIEPDSFYSWNIRLRIAEELNELERRDDALAELRALADERPENYDPHYRMGNILRSEERFDEAASAYEEAVARLGEERESFWLVYYFRGITYERTDRWDLAEADFLKALDLRPEQPYVMNYLAYSWVEQRSNLKEAEEMLVRAVELQPDDGYIVDSLGWVYYRLGRFEEAVVELERAVELRPEDPTINDHLGDAYWRVGRDREARVQWSRALSLEPEEEEVVENIQEKLESHDPPVAEAEMLQESQATQESLPGGEGDPAEAAKPAGNDI